jgi:hypothetical protein
MKLIIISVMYPICGFSDFKSKNFIPHFHNNYWRNLGTSHTRWIDQIQNPQKFGGGFLTLRIHHIWEESIIYYIYKKHKWSYRKNEDTNWFYVMITELSKFQILQILNFAKYIHKKYVKQYNISGMKNDANFGRVCKI